MKISTILASGIFAISMLGLNANLFSQTCHHPKDTYYLCHLEDLDCNESEAEDAYGFFKFQSSSYVACKINQALGYAETNLPKESYPFYNEGWGEAGNWLNWAEELEYPVYKEAHPHTVAFWSSEDMDLDDATGGHVAWVEAIKPDGTIIVSDYNAVLCKFSIGEIPPTGCKHFIGIPGVNISDEISEAYNEPDAKVYKDPVTGQLMLEISGNGPFTGQAELINYERKIHYKLPLEGKVTQIPQANLISGSYIARITMPHQVITVRIQVME